ncbi:Ras-like protein [Acrasis kona]|uniref:small monomeric GTPase n=1 Tax=Acrasis kona TaxID=1008807 RepID=A0AAW2Z7V9_9EUKA
MWLPPEILVNIINFLPPDALLHYKLSLVCKDFKAVADSEDRWKEILYYTFPDSKCYVTKNFKRGFFQMARFINDLRNKKILFNNNENEDLLVSFRKNIKIVGDRSTGKSLFFFQWSQHGSFAEGDEEERHTKIIKFNGKYGMTFSEVIEDVDRIEVGKCDGIFVLYSITDRKSFVHAQLLLDSITLHSNSVRKSAVVLIGNKSDAAEDRVVQYDEGTQLAAKHGAQFTETTSMDKLDVQGAFLVMVKELKRLDVNYKKLWKQIERGSSINNRLNCKIM